MSEAAVIPTEKFNITKLADVELPDTFDGMLALLHEQGIEIENAAGVLADEWPEVEKERLVNLPFLLATWQVSKPDSSDFSQYLVCRGITKDGKRFRFTDGSTGVMKQLAKLTWERTQNGQATPNAGLLVPRGLTISEYDYTDDKGKTSKARTYYLSNAE